MVTKNVRNSSHWIALIFIPLILSFFASCLSETASEPPHSSSDIAALHPYVVFWAPGDPNDVNIIKKGVGIEPQIQIGFSQLMETTLENAQEIKILAGGESVDFTYVWEEYNELESKANQIVITPSAPLGFLQTITVVVTKFIESTSGKQMLDDFVFKFETREDQGSIDCQFKNQTKDPLTLVTEPVEESSFLPMNATSMLYKVTFNKPVINFTTKTVVVNNGAAVNIYPMTDCSVALADFVIPDPVEGGEETEDPDPVDPSTVPTQCFVVEVVGISMCLAYDLFIGQEEGLGVTELLLDGECKKLRLSEAVQRKIQLDCETDPPSFLGKTDYTVSDADADSQYIDIEFNEPVAFSRENITPAKYRLNISTEQLDTEGKKFRITFENIEEWNQPYYNMGIEKVKDLHGNELAITISLVVYFYHCKGDEAAPALISLKVLEDAEDPGTELDLTSAAITVLYDPNIKPLLELNFSESVRGLKKAEKEEDEGLVFSCYGHPNPGSCDVDLGYTFENQNDFQKFILDFNATDWVDMSDTTGDEHQFQLIIKGEGKNGEICDPCGNCTASSLTLLIKTYDRCYASEPEIPKVVNSKSEHTSDYFAPESFDYTLRFNNGMKNVAHDGNITLKYDGPRSLTPEQEDELTKLIVLTTDSVKEFKITYETTAIDKWVNNDVFILSINAKPEDPNGLENFCGEKFEESFEARITFLKDCPVQAGNPAVVSGDQLYPKGTVEGEFMIRFDYPVLMTEGNLGILTCTSPNCAASGQGHYDTSAPYLYEADPFNQTTYLVKFTGTVDDETYEFVLSGATNICGDYTIPDTVFTFRILPDLMGDDCSAPFDLTGNQGYWYKIPGIYNGVATIDIPCDTYTYHEENIFYAKYTKTPGAFRLKWDAKGGMITAYFATSDTPDVLCDLVGQVGAAVIDDAICNTKTYDVPAMYVDQPMYFYFLIHRETGDIIDPEFLVQEIHCQDIVPQVLLTAPTDGEMNVDARCDDYQLPFLADPTYPLTWIFTHPAKSNKGEIIIGDGLAGDAEIFHYDLAVTDIMNSKYLDPATDIAISGGGSMFQLDPPDCIGSWDAAMELVVKLVGFETIDCSKPIDGEFRFKIQQCSPPLYMELISPIKLNDVDPAEVEPVIRFSRPLNIHDMLYHDSFQVIIEAIPDNGANQILYQNSWSTIEPCTRDAYGACSEGCDDKYVGDPIWAWQCDRNSLLETGCTYPCKADRCYGLPTSCWPTPCPPGPRALCEQDCDAQCVWGMFFNAKGTEATIPSGLYDYPENSDILIRVKATDAECSETYDDYVSFRTIDCENDKFMPHATLITPPRLVEVSPKTPIVIGFDRPMQPWEGHIRIGETNLVAGNEEIEFPLWIQPGWVEWNADGTVMTITLPRELQELSTVLVTIDDMKALDPCPNYMTSTVFSFKTKEFGHYGEDCTDAIVLENNKLNEIFWEARELNVLTDAAVAGTSILTDCGNSARTIDVVFKYIAPENGIVQINTTTPVAADNNKIDLWVFESTCGVLEDNQRPDGTNHVCTAGILTFPVYYGIPYSIYGIDLPEKIDMTVTLIPESSCPINAPYPVPGYTHYQEGYRIDGHKEKTEQPSDPRGNVNGTIDQTEYLDDSGSYPPDGGHALSSVENAEYIGDDMGLTHIGDVVQIRGTLQDEALTGNDIYKVWVYGRTDLTFVIEATYCIKNAEETKTHMQLYKLGDYLLDGSFDPHKVRPMAPVARQNATGDPVTKVGWVKDDRDFGNFFFVEIGENEKDSPYTMGEYTITLRVTDIVDMQEWTSFIPGWLFAATIYDDQPDYALFTSCVSRNFMGFGELDFGWLDISNGSIYNVYFQRRWGFIAGCGCGSEGNHVIGLYEDVTNNDPGCDSFAGYEYKEDDAAEGLEVFKWYFLDGLKPRKTYGNLRARVTNIGGTSSDCCYNPYDGDYGVVVEYIK